MSVVHVILLQNEKNTVENEKKVKSAVDHSATALVADESGWRHLIRHESARRLPLYKNNLFKKIIARARGNSQKNEAHHRVLQNIPHFMVLILSGKLGLSSHTLLVNNSLV